MVDEEVTDRHRPFGLVIKLAGIWREGEFNFPDMETISTLRYGHRSSSSDAKNVDILHWRVVLATTLFLIGTAAGIVTLLVIEPAELGGLGVAESGV